MPGYALTDAEADVRYRKFQSEDPFPRIPASVLNIADISDYVSVVGIVHPFPTSGDLLKPASFGIPLKGRCVYWEDNGKLHDFILSDDKIERYPETEFEYRKDFEVLRNSIVFVTLEPRIRLPDYIALRFNLAIREVYRGFLLGTGPMVDPGFQGNLSFPLHNLTDQPYRLNAGEQIVWVELTKISPIPAWDTGQTSPVQAGIFHRFPDRKIWDRSDVLSYLVHANKGQPVRSSIPVEIEKARVAAEGARDRAVSVETWQNSLKRYSLIGGLGVAAGIAALIYGGYTIVSGTIGLIDNARKEASDSTSRADRLSGQMQQFQSKFDANEKTTLEQLDQIRNALDIAEKKSTSDISGIKTDLNDLKRSMRPTASARKTLPNKNKTTPK